MIYFVTLYFVLLPLCDPTFCHGHQVCLSKLNHCIFVFFMCTVVLYYAIVQSSVYTFCIYICTVIFFYICSIMTQWYVSLCGVVV
jgi:hypothetical protein